VNVLVGAEFSGVVREAFRRRGHNAWSCDLEPAEDGSRYHVQGDVRELLGRAWDLGIFHLPCTYFCNSGVRWYTTIPKHPRPGVVYGPPRWALFEEAVALWLAVQRSRIPRLAMENPIPHKYARAKIGRYSQIVQPNWFGHGETKATCLWLRNLPPLYPTDSVPGREPRVHHASPGPDRWKERSRTLPGLGAAMAAQWG
jgi:hypothetical protein